MSAYSIAELSKALNLTAPTLRYYEEIGLLPPVLRNTSGQRVYTEEHLDRLHAILCFKNAGMSIADIQKFFTYEANEQTQCRNQGLCPSAPQGGILSCHQGFPGPSNSLSPMAGL